MDWFKKHYDRVALLLLAAVLLGSSVYMFFGVQEFPARFAAILKEVKHGDTATTFETEALERAQASILNPTKWDPEHPGSLFISRKYVGKYDLVLEREILIDPFEPGSSPLHPPVPNSWFQKHGLADKILEHDLLQQDPDDDGFNILEEYLGDTDPRDANSRPCYTTKLRLLKFVRIPFRLIFQAYDDGDFQINTVDVRQPTQFVKMGDVIEGTKFKVVKFEKKSVYNDKIEMDKDVSELTVEHTETGLQVVLVLEKVTNSPDQYADFAFLWKDSKPFRVKKDGTFSLKPEPDVKYKLIDIKDAEAVIFNIKTSEEIKIPRK